MSKKKLIILGIFLLSGILILYWIVNGVIKERMVEKREKLCLETFDIENPEEHYFLLLENKIMRGFSGSSLLLEYFFCRAVINNDLGECEKLKKIMVDYYYSPESFIDYYYSPESSYELCRNLLFYNNFWNKILATKECKDEIIQVCIKKSGWGNTLQEKQEKCMALCQGSLSKNISFCKQKFYNTPIGVAACKAFISGDENWCNSSVIQENPLEEKACRRTTNYVSVVRTGKKENCASMADKKFRILCEIYFSTLEGKKYTCPSLEEIEKAYCQQWARNK